eukprot:Plantae.Rhodophyta-Purpureofilum_apyrenoidigerum.ctg13278.p1 GENE.Plantae.Rhodophyta-Purpureofilum_apyrenoidigerum.ctg13278~~Plantae.Rhodophyta-Purpureofilum_apyrenoidigerum.ctg13278.p1  ORF type:complete len:427 (-),score=101.08 Plantae.Rhodophyta-Purpureofilum_apyrenoidigerum.ctg13278:168-1448(-)
MVVSAIFILDSKGKPLISRNFRGDVDANVANDFKAKVIDAEDESQIRPIFRLDDKERTYVYIKHANLYVVGVSLKNSNAAVLLEFLYKLLAVFKTYFKDVQEESIRDNFVVIYELLDEMMDFGFPQVSEGKVLKQYITQDYHVLEVPRLPVAVTNAVSWRSEGVRHSRNEVFLDVIERVNIIISGNGTTLRSEILGKLMVKSYLSGMPDLKLGLNDKLQLGENSQSKREKSVELEDIKFHQCVRLSKFEDDRTISFIPPDGEFELMSYRLNMQVRPLIWVDAVIEHRTSRIDYLVKVRAQLKPFCIANNVQVHIPVIFDADTPQFKCSQGKYKYVPQKDELIWSIKQLKAGRELVMRGNFSLPSIGEDKDRDSATKRPITVDFEVPYFAVSGLQVRFLKVHEKSGYQSLPWVRYITKAGDYQIRVV